MSLEWLQEGPFIWRRRSKYEINGSDHRTAHIGYFLIDKGLPELESEGRMHRSLWGKLGAMGRKKPITVSSRNPAGHVLGDIACRRIFGSEPGNRMDGCRPSVCRCKSSGGWTGQLGFDPAGQTDASASYGFFKRDSAGIPELVTVPTMLINPENVAGLLEAEIEIRYLANRDEKDVVFLLTDFRDASKRTLIGRTKSCCNWHGRESRVSMKSTRL